ncbi:MAG: tRNA (adenosine(37)-N6)-threonylcarbamoyltransferase complex dimerization subunit type 1 TsaB [Bryobacteraceae bacterium]|nr:tRNA (adenosine(37)-N6)-threonylcarbamoyltransferase complex dimerization subunit type 1 TsaB [Bryobacteraceae bacterium]
MRVLALDTTTERGSLALLADGELLEESELLGPDGFAQILFPAIVELLRRHGCTLPDIGLFAAAAGPGSFTGVRVGVTAVKGLAEATGRPAQAISNLRALADQGTANVRLPLIHARRGEVYLGHYDASLRALEPERNGQLSALIPVPAAGIVCQAAWPELAASGLAYELAARPLAGSVARLALAEGGGDPAALDANYVRRSDADGRWHDT